MKLDLTFWLAAVIAVLLPLLRAEAVPQESRALAQYSIRWVPDPAETNKVVVEVFGLSTAALQQLKQSNREPAQWQRLLSIYAAPDELEAENSVTPMLGVYEVEARFLRFRPQFPLTPGLTYRAVFYSGRLPGQGGGGEAPIVAAFQLPGRASNPTTVMSRIYPSANVLPENLLKFYLCFSAPMRRGHSYDYIHLRNESGKDVELPFLEIDEELWDPTMTRFTLFIDPGRIKRGVRPLEEIGPALQEGKQYTLAIDREWEDATGNPLKETFRKTFRVGRPDRDPPDPAHWRIQSPKSDAREAVTILFPKPMDYALAQRVIRVVAGSGKLVDGKIAMEDQERRWGFVPNKPWRRGSYTLLIQTTIEDLAGNNIGKPFEVDVFEGIQRELTNATIKLPFEVR